MIYTHVMARPDIRIVSPLDRLFAEMPRVEAVAKVDSVAKLKVERVEKTEADGDGDGEALVGAPALAGLSQIVSTQPADADKPALTQRAETGISTLVTPRGMRAIFTSFLSHMFGRMRDVRDEDRPAPHPPAPSPRIEEKGDES